MERKIISSYFRKLRYTVGLSRPVNTAVICTLCGIPDVEFWMELTRVTFKYRAMRKDVPGTHRTLDSLAAGDLDGYSSWSASEKHGERMGIVGNQMARHNEIKLSMAKWRQDRCAAITSEKLDHGVLEQFVLNPRHFLTIDEHGERVNSWERPQYRKWLSNSDFVLTVECLGGGNNLFNRECICFGCDLQPRSWVHLRRCDCIPDGARPNLYILPQNEAICRSEVRKLRKLCEFFTPDSNLDLSGHFISRFEEKTLQIYYVSRCFDDQSYRLFNNSTGMISIENIRPDYLRGRIFVESTSSSSRSHVDAAGSGN